MGINNRTCELRLVLGRRSWLRAEFIQEAANCEANFECVVWVCVALEAESTETHISGRPVNRRGVLVDPGRRMTASRRRAQWTNTKFRHTDHG